MKILTSNKTSEKSIKQLKRWFNSNPNRQVVAIRTDDMKPIKGSYLISKDNGDRLHKMHHTKSLIKKPALVIHRSSFFN